MIFKSLFFSSLFFLSTIALSNSLIVHVGNTVISGNAKTKDFIISRELLLVQDSTYKLASRKELNYLIKQSENRILNLNLFNKVNVSTSPLKNSGTDTIDLHIEVIEKWYIWPLPIIEFSDRHFNIWSNLDFDPTRTNYGIYIDQYNVFGRNHTFKTRLKTGYNNQVEAEYRIPFLGPHTSWGVSGQFQYNSQNEVWYQTRNDSLQFFKNGSEDLIRTTGAQIQFSKRIAPFVNIYTGVGYQYTQLDDAVPSQNFLVQNRLEQHHTSLHYRLEHDTRDNIYFPLKGIFISPEVSIHRFGIKEASHNIQFKLKAQRYSQVKPKLYTALSINTKLNTLSTLGYLNRKQLGYDRIIRGFEHYVIEGLFGTNATAALRYHFLDKSDLTLDFIPIKNYKILPINAFLEAYADGGYVDAGNMNRQTAFPEFTNSLPNTILFSGGVGLNLLFYNDRILRLEYSVNSLKDDGIFVHFQTAI